MILGIFFILIGVFILYLIIDFLVIKKGNINGFIDKWVTKTLWIWLPIHGLKRLIKEVILKK